jgi:hypothetical protein
MSSWTQKLEKRLTALADAASKESMQTLAKWICFNRKHSAAFCEALTKGMEDITRRWLYYQVIHEIMMLEKGSDKWDKLQDIRTAIGDCVVIVEIEKLENVILIDQLKPLVDQWDNANVFGGPMLIQRIQHCLKNPKKAVEATAPVPEIHTAVPEEKPADEATPEQEPEAIEKPELTSDQAEAKRIDGILDISLKPRLEMREESFRSLGEQDDVVFDFEAEVRFFWVLCLIISYLCAPTKFNTTQGIPEGKVDAKELLEPCKALVTFQIARDLRADTAAQLTSILSLIPDDVKSSYRETNGDDITEDQVQTLSVQLTDNVLDIDLDEALQNVETFRELVQKQHAARQRLVNLLIKSRCQFGSNEAAEAFFGLEEIKEKLSRRKELLSDAMDLEGLDVEEGDKAGDTDIVKQLAPLTWYKNETNGDEAAAKRPKLQG